MSEAARRANYTETLELAARMKAQKVKPNIGTYRSLMMAASSQRMWLDAWAILDDMIAFGLKPDAHNACSSDYIWRVLKKMKELNVEPDATTFSVLIVRFLSNGNLELALQYYHEMKNQGLVPDIETANRLVTSIAQSGYPRLADDLAEDFEAASVRRLDWKTSMSCLGASAEAFYIDGVKRNWQKVVGEAGMNPGEGVCLAVSDAAARNGFPDLVTDALRNMQALGIQFQEYHFAPLIEAFCRRGDLESAVKVLDIMQSYQVNPSPETASGLLDALNGPEPIDLLWGITDKLLQDGKHIHLTVLHVLIKASVKLGDLQRAIGAYKSLPEYGAQADITIFNSLLLGCVTASHRPLGDLLLDDMKALQIKPDQETFETFIFLCLTQNEYEDAFFYLEEMKAAGFNPGYDVYAGLVTKCINADDSRYSIALKEMQEMGHQPRMELKKLMKHKEGGQQSRNTLRRPSLDGAARRFIESGGIEGAPQLPTELPIKHVS
ncbi:hypothetical protein H0H93_008610 [Arthromyces matolae]|nr:hypothetical protein H0H93_008610 [Arthromyces matolae]